MVDKNRLNDAQSKPIPDELIRLISTHYPFPMNGVSSTEGMVDMTGQRIGRWTVVGNPTSRSKRAVSWLCVCDCGTLRYVGGEKLRQGSSLSCGCGSAADLSGMIVEKWKYMFPVRDPKGNLVWAVSHEEFPGVFPLFPQKKNLSSTVLSRKLDGPPWLPSTRCWNTCSSPAEAWVSGICFDRGMPIYHNEGLNAYIVAAEATDISTVDISAILPNRYRDISGKIVDPWKILDRVGSNDYGQSVWRCCCTQCNNIAELSVISLSKYYTATCGKCGAKGKKKDGTP